MARRVSYFQLGAFVLGSFAVIVAGIILLSSGAFSHGPKLMLETYVGGSVEGVTHGSEVHYRGIPVGSVQQVALTADVYESHRPFEQRRPYVLLRFDLQTRALGHLSRDQARDLIRRWVDEGLHVSQRPRGLSGNSFLDLDFVTTAQPESSLAYDWTPRYPVVPEAPNRSGNLGDVLAEAHAALAQISAINLSGSREKLDAILQTALQAAQDVRSLVGDPKLRQAVDDVGRAADGLDAMVAASRPEVVTAAEKLRQTSVRLDAATTNVPAAVANLNRSLEQVSSLLSTQRGDIAGAVRNLERAAENLRVLLEQARQNPGLLFGGPPPRVKP